MKRFTLNLNYSFNICETLRTIRGLIEKEISIDFIKRKKHFNYSEEEVGNIREELELILLSKKVRDIFTVLQEMGILNVIIPELSSCYRFKQHSKYHNRDVFNHILYATSIVPYEINIRLAALLHDIAKPSCFSMDLNGDGHFYGHDVLSSTVAKSILKRFEYDEKTINKVCILIKNHMKKFKFSSAENIEVLINIVGIENVKDLLILQIADDLSKNPKYININPLINMYNIVKVEWLF